MDRLTIRNKYGDINPPYQLTSQDEEDDWSSDCRKKLAYYEDLEVRCGIIIGVTIEDSICSYERLEEKLKEMNNQ